jgi:alpha-beta hydrolase superfamily lysophospholipase
MNQQPPPNPVFERLRAETTGGAAGACTEEFLALRDGTRVFVRTWTPDAAPNRIVLCFHGAGGHGEFFALFADVLVPTGAAVVVADYLGHGKSEGARGDYPSFDTLLDDANEVANFARAKFPGLPLFILGESMGGAMAVNFTARHADAVSGLILFSPALLFRKSIPWPQILYFPYYFLFAAVSPGSPVIRMSGHEHEGIRNLTHQEYDRTDPLHLTHISPRYFFQLNKYMSIALNQCPQNITCPTILFQGETDPGIDPAGARSFIERLAAQEKELVIYPKGLHVLLTDSEVKDVADRLLAWIGER